MLPRQLQPYRTTAWRCFECAKAFKRPIVLGFLPVRGERIFCNEHSGVAARRVCSAEAAERQNCRPLSKG